MTSPIIMEGESVIWAKAHWQPFLLHCLNILWINIGGPLRIYYILCSEHRGKTKKKINRVQGKKIKYSRDDMDMWQGCTNHDHSIIIYKYQMLNQILTSITFSRESLRTNDECICKLWLTSYIDTKNILLDLE